MFLLITTLAGCTHPAPHAVTPPAPSPHISSTSTLPATFPGPDGVEARWVIQENDKPGTAAWKIHGHAAGVAGVAGQVYAAAGQQVTLYVSTAAPWFRAQAFRMGWYQGQGARLIWTSAPVKGKNQPACRVRAGFLEPGLHVGLRVADASAWVFAGTGLHNGEVIPGVVASDVDKADRAYGQPADDQILATRRSRPASARPASAPSFPT
jgi:hypothetical protein